MKICLTCGLEKEDELFRKNRNQCLACHHEYLKQYRVQNKDELKIKRADYVKDNPEKIVMANRKNYETHKDARKEYGKEYYLVHQTELIDYAHEYYQENKEDITKQARNYYQENKDKLIAKKIVYQRNRYRNDPVYRLRSLVGRVVSRMMKANGSSKNGGSIVDHLPYSFQELKEHIESQFESWMSWDNQGKYDPQSWKDDDQTTWTWQLDHIIPQTSLSYISMTDDNFKKCWALNNLRPLSAKQNLLDGSKRTRHE